MRWTLRFGLWALGCTLGIGCHCSDISPEKLAQSSADYSALECIQKAGMLNGKPVQMIRLLTSKYLRTQGDTTVSDLTALAQEAGMQDDAYEDLSVAQLRHATFPAILRVRGSRYSAKPDHFIVCLNIAYGQARIFNPPGTEKTVPLECLATRWKGEALIPRTGDTKVDLSLWRYESYLPTAALWFLAVTSILGIRLWRRRSAKSVLSKVESRRSKASFVLQPAALVVAAAVLGFGSRLLLGLGLVVQAATPASAEGPDPMDFLLQTDASGAISEKVPDIDLDTALSLHTTGALFIDAREASEFVGGHIKGAMNCAASDVGHLRLNMAGIPKTRNIAVYCISSHCGKGAYLAAALMQQGFTHVALYRDGWVKWTGSKE